MRWSIKIFLLLTQMFLRCIYICNLISIFRNELNKKEIRNIKINKHKRKSVD